MKCNDCGRILKKEMLFCGNCGTKAGEKKTIDLGVVDSMTLFSSIIIAIIAAINTSSFLTFILVMLTGVFITFVVHTLIDSEIKEKLKTILSYSFIYGVIFFATVQVSNIIREAIVPAAKSGAEWVANKIDTIPENNQQSTSTSSSSSSQNNTQQNRSSSNQVEVLTYYVRGNRKTANVIFDHYQESRFYLDAGGNIIRNTRHQFPGENWSDWQDNGIVQRHRPELVGLTSIWGWLLATNDFHSAMEQTVNRARFILTWENYGQDFLGNTTFFHDDGKYVYTMQKIYSRQ